MGGLLGGIGDLLFGGVDKIGVSGGFQNLGPVGKDFSNFLLKRLQQDPADSDAFRSSSEAIFEALGRQSGAARQRLGDRAITGGFADSGGVTSALTDIDRAELQASGSAIRDLILGLEDRRTQGILPFLTAGSNELLGVGSANMQAESASRGQNMGFATKLASMGTDTAFGSFFNFD